MKRRRKREFSIFSLSFLDVVCCGFGAVILLFVIALGSEVETEEILPREAVLERMAAARESERQALSTQRQGQERLAESLRGEKQALLQELSALRQQKAESESLLERQLAEEVQTEEEIQRLKGTLATRREWLEAPPDPSLRAIPVGIPLERTHVVFVIDTSGSMRGGMFLLNVVVEKVREVMEVYPTVRQVQFLTADGEYLISGSNGRWLDDRPDLRQQFLQQLRTAPGSSSNPEGGIVEGIRLARQVRDDPGTRVGIFVFGDEFDSNPEPAARRITRLNRDDRVSISAIGFDQRLSPHLSSTGLRFVNFMRIVAQENDGAFVGVRAR